MRAGFDVVADPTLEARAEFTPGKFAYNADTMTRLDVSHEWRHFNQLQQMMDSGIDISNSTLAVAQAPAEFGAYRYEEALWRRIGAEPTPDYLQFHNSQLDAFESELFAFRSFAAKGYNAQWRGIQW